MSNAARVQQGPFDPGAELNAFSARNPKSGGVAVFVGQMRDFTTGGVISEMTLEHYPGMAERQLADVIAEARRRWTLDDVFILHRFGTLRPGEAIVFVATASAHRAPALESCEFLIDWLKTQAPFWKLEETAEGSRWVDARDSDKDAASRWLAPAPAAK